MTTKPLGHKAYGSIGHLPGSRLGPGDHCVPDGQARICTEKRRDKHDWVWVQEKLDGCCMSVAKIDGQIIALGRAGYSAVSAPHEHMRMFAVWVERRQELFEWLLKDEERFVGEWLALAHGTRYDLDGWEPLVVFDLMRGHESATVNELYSRVRNRLQTPKTWIGHGEPVSPTVAYSAFESMNDHPHIRTLNALDPIEGIVYRVERRGKVDFLAKWVRPGKVDGCLLPEISGAEPVWQWDVDQGRLLAVTNTKHKMRNMLKLKPCPFCGEAPVYGIAGPQFHEVIHRCPVLSQTFVLREDDLDNAVGMWNTRWHKRSSQLSLAWRWIANHTWAS